jgi:hypothetical protein
MAQKNRLMSVAFSALGKVLRAPFGRKPQKTWKCQEIIFILKIDELYQGSKVTIRL